MNQLYFNPSTQNVQANSPLTLEIWADTGGVGIDGIDIFLPLQGLILTRFQAGTMIANNFQDVHNGVLRCAFVAPLGQKFTGAGVLALLTLTAAQSTTLAFDFTLGATNDTNMSRDGVDILTDVGTTTINTISTPMPPALQAAIQAAVTANAPGAKIVISTYTPAPIPGSPVTLNLTITG